MAATKDISKDVNRGLAWVGAASSVVALLDIIAQVIILAVWISPRELGIATLAIPFFPMLDKATDMGLSAAVIQRDDHTAEKISTVFWLNVTISLVMFAALALVIGPALSAWQGHAVVGLMLTVYGGKLIFQNFYFIPAAMMRRELRFDELSVIRVIANVAEFAGKIGFAWGGFGIWCFVLGPLCRVAVTGVGIQLRHPWRPMFTLQVREALDWAAFGIKTSASQVLFHLYTNVDYLVVGKYFGPVANGYYRLAYEIVLEPCRIISDVVIEIAFPAFSRLKAMKTRLIEQFVAFTRLNLVVMIGFLGVVFVSGADLIHFMRDGEWVPAVAAIKILCAVGILRALSFIVPPLLDGIGRPSLTLIYTSVAAVVLPSSFVLAAEYGAQYFASPYLSVAVAWAIGYPVAFVVLFAMALRVMDLSASAYLRRVVGIPIIGLGCVILSYLVHVGLERTPTAVRLVAASATMLAPFFILLARYEGISPRKVAAAIRGDG